MAILITVIFFGCSVVEEEIKSNVNEINVDDMLVKLEEGKFKEEIYFDFLIIFCEKIGVDNIECRYLKLNKEDDKVSYSNYESKKYKYNTGKYLNNIKEQNSKELVTNHSYKIGESINVIKSIDGYIFNYNNIIKNSDNNIYSKQDLFNDIVELNWSGLLHSGNPSVFVKNNYGVLLYLKENK